MRLIELATAGDWLGVLAHEREALALAQELRGADPGAARAPLGILGAAFNGVGQNSRAREMHEQDKAISEALGDRAGVAVACDNLGSCYHSTGDYGRAREMHEQAKAISEALGDRAGVARACGSLGNCYFVAGDLGRAREMHEQAKAICEALGDRAGVAHTCGNLGSCYSGTGDHARAREMYEQVKAICEALGDRAGMAKACTGLGNCYFSTGDYGRARKMYEQCEVICEAMGDRAGVAMAYGNLGICYTGTGDYARASVLYEQAKAIFEALGDRTGVATACGGLGDCYASTGEYATALTFYKKKHVIATELEIEHMRESAAMSIGVALRLHVRADRQAAVTSPALMEVGAVVEIHSLQKSPELNGMHGEIIKSQDLGTGRCGVKTATGREVALKQVNLRLIRAPTGPDPGASRVPDPRSLASASLEDRMKEAATWLNIALTGGCGLARLHLAHLAFAGQNEDIALEHLKRYLSWCVARGRDWCKGCEQKRGEDTPMLTCNGCRVARFCSADHQKMASKSVASGGSLQTGRHKDICGLLGKWRGVEKDGVSPDSLRADLLGFLRQSL